MSARITVDGKLYTNEEIIQKEIIIPENSGHVVTLSADEGKVSMERTGPGYYYVAKDVEGTIDIEGGSIKEMSLGGHSNYISTVGTISPELAEMLGLK